MEVAGRGQGLITNPTAEHTPVCDRSNPPIYLDLCCRCAQEHASQMTKNVPSPISSPHWKCHGKSEKYGMWPKLLCERGQAPAAAMQRGTNGHHRAAMGLQAHLPFLTVFLPSRWSSTGSTVSPMSSISSVCPSETACSMVSR